MCSSDLARLQRRAYQQRWFIGTHGDVGGGDGSKLAANTLKWMAEGARDAGLRFYASHGADTSPLDDALAEAGMCFDARISRPPLSRMLQPINYPWRGRKIWARKELPTLAEAEDCLDSTVIQRALAKKPRPRYRPGPLRPFQKALKEWRPPT